MIIIVALMLVVFFSFLFDSFVFTLRSLMYCTVSAFQNIWITVTINLIEINRHERPKVTFYSLFVQFFLLTPSFHVLFF